MRKLILHKSTQEVPRWHRAGQEILALEHMSSRAYLTEQLCYIPTVTHAALSLLSLLDTGKQNKSSFATFLARLSLR